jgi:hypothetical protein
MGSGLGLGFGSGKAASGGRSVPAEMGGAAAGRAVTGMGAQCEPRRAAPAAAAAAGTRETREPAVAAVAAARRCATALVAVAAEGVTRRGDDADGDCVSVVSGAVALPSSKRFASSVRACASASTSSSVTLTRLAVLESQRSSTLRKCASDDFASVLRDSSRLGGAGDEVHDEPGESERLGS